VIAIRDMQESDTADIIMQVMWAYPSWLHSLFNIDLSATDTLSTKCKQVLADQFSNPNTFYGGYVALDDDNIVGHIWLYLMENDTTSKIQAQILSIYVRPDYRGKWIHRKLIVAAELWAKAKECSALSGMVVCNNKLALKSAIKEGFTVTRYEVYKPI